MDKTRLGLMIHHTTENDRAFRSTDIRFDFSLVRVDDKDKVTNLGHSFMDDPHKWLDQVTIGLRVTTGEFNTAKRPLDHYVSIYMEAYKPGLSEVQSAAKALKRIEGRMGAINKVRGYTSDGPEIIGRFCEVIKADCIVEVRGKASNWHNDNEHRFMTIGEGIDNIRRIIADDDIFQNAVKQAMERVAA